MDMEIIGSFDYTDFAQSEIYVNEDNKVSGMANGKFWNPYRNEEKAVLDTFGNDKEGTVQITAEGNVVTVDTCLTSGCKQAQAEIAADPQANPPIVGQAAVEGVDWSTNVIIIE